MILNAIAIISIFQVHVGGITETKLFKNQKGKVTPGSITISPDLTHFAYSTMDHKLTIDGRSFGPFLSNGTVLFSRNSDDYAFLASQKLRSPSSLFFNGVERPMEFPIESLFLAGETGGICWVERDKALSRLVYPGGVTEWFEKIEKISFSEDGSLFYLKISEKLKVPEGTNINADTPTSSDYIVRKDGSKQLRDTTVHLFPAPNSQGYAVLSNDNSVSFRGKIVKYKGEFYGKPLFSPDGKQLAFRNSFTGTTATGKNIPFYQYNINGYSIPDLQVQTGLTFAQDGKKWVMCGLNGKELFLYVSSQGMMSFEEFPLLAGAPKETYKEARFANGKIVLLFQPKRARPVLFVEEKGIVELGELTSAPETMTISPDGRTLLVGCSDQKELRAYAVNLENPGPAVEIMKKGYDLQNLGKGTFVWKSDRDVQFLILRNSEIVRVSAKL